MRQSAPPWAAPRDAISYIEAAQLPKLALDDTTDPWIVQITVKVSGQPVEVPAFIGVDRLRAVQAPLHTHDVGGEVWLEGEGNRTVTLGHFFRLWGIRFNQSCLADRCNNLRVTADSKLVDSPEDLLLRGVKTVTVDVD